MEVLISDSEEIIGHKRHAAKGANQKRGVHGRLGPLAKHHGQDRHKNDIAEGPTTRRAKTVG